MEPEPATKTDENELQKAISNITSVGGADAGADAVSAVADRVAASNTEGVSAPEVVAAPETSAPAGAISLAPPPQRATYGNPDLDRVKARALADLRPLVDRIDLPPESKFKIYREIILVTNDKAAIEPAYDAATRIAEERDRAEALLFVVETVDRLGIGAASQAN